MNTHKIILGDCIAGMQTLPTGCIHTCITSPPYWGLRDYGHKDQLGAEKTPDDYVTNLVKVFREVRRVLRDDGTVWLNLGDSYYGGMPIAGLKPKDLIGIPWRVAFALQADGWWLRQDIIWHKPNPMPESVTDRCTKAHEYIFLLSKKSHYFFDHEAIKEELSDPQRTNFQSGKRTNGINKDRNDNDLGSRSKTAIYSKKNKRSVWTVTTKPFRGAHFATFPKDLIEPCVLAGCPVGGTVLDPFTGSGTTAVVALENGRNFVGTELNPEYIKIAEARILDEVPNTLEGMFEDRS